MKKLMMLLVIAFAVPACGKKNTTPPPANPTDPAAKPADPAANPCGGANPCAPANPCGGNPCAPK